MLSRSAVRSARVLRAPQATRLNGQFIRFNTTSTQKEAAKSGGSSGAVVGGLAGAGAALAIGYGWYHFSGAKTLVQTAQSTKSSFNKLTASMKEATPEPNQALDWLRSTSTSYAAFIPGAKGYVDAAFNDLDKVQAKHGHEVDEIVSKAYSEIQSVVSSNQTITDKAQKSWTILEKYLKELGELAADSASEILDNHPEIKEKVGGNMDQLKHLGDKFGPEAKKQVSETYSQISKILAGGISVDAASKIKDLIQEKTEQVQKLGDEAWKKGIEQAKPYLDKSPQVKELVEKNADSLKTGNFSELYNQIKKSVDSGKTEDLQAYVESAKDKASKGMGADFDKYIKMIPGGDKIFPKLKQLQDVAQKHGDEAEKILKETYSEIQEVLQKRVSQAEKLAQKAQKDAKK